MYKKLWHLLNTWHLYFMVEYAENGRIMGSVSGVPAKSLADKLWLVFQALGDIAFAYPYSIILLEIQVWFHIPIGRKKKRKLLTEIESEVLNFDEWIRTLSSLHHRKIKQWERRPWLQSSLQHSSTSVAVALDMQPLEMIHLEISWPALAFMSLTGSLTLLMLALFFIW